MKFEIDSNDTITLHHIGAALMSIAADKRDVMVPTLKININKFLDEWNKPEATPPAPEPVAEAPETLDEVTPLAVRRAGDISNAKITMILTDANGDEWNEELHSSSKAINKDGTWKARRNVKATPPAPEPVAEAPEPVAEATPPAPEPVAEAITPPAPEPVAEAITPLPPTERTVNFSDLMRLITTRKDMFTSALVGEIVRSHGGTTLPVLRETPDILAAVYAHIEDMING